MARGQPARVAQHPDRRGEKRSRIRGSRHARRRRDAPHEWPRVVGAQLVGFQADFPHPPSRRTGGESHGDRRPRRAERARHRPATQLYRQRGRRRPRRAGHADREASIRQRERSDAAIRRRGIRRGDGEHPHAARDGHRSLERGALQVADHVHLTRRHRFRLHQSGRAVHNVDQRQAPGVGPGAVDRCQQCLPRTGPRDAVGEHQPQPVPGTGAGERRVRHSLQPIEQWPPVHDDAGGG